MSLRGRYVRRYDRNGHSYFIDRETGRRVSGEKWQRERTRLNRQKPPTPKQVPQKPTPPSPSPLPPSPFPPDVSYDGYPLDDDGFLDDDAFAIEGDDDT